MKKIIYNFIIFVIHFLLYLSCYLKLHRFCAYLIKFTLIKSKHSVTNSKNKKIFIVLDRIIGGRRDIEIVQKFSKKKFKILFMRRSIAKIIFTFFCNKKKFFFNYHKPRPVKEDYFNLSETNKKKYEMFWTKVIHHLKNYLGKKDINLITFAYYYYVEFGLYAGCKNNQIPVKLWNKECFMSDEDVKHRVKIKEYQSVFQYFDKISVYNNFMKKMLIGMDKKNIGKISVNGCPRTLDFISKNKKHKRIKNLLFLSFNTKQGFPDVKKNKNLTWNISYDKVIKILNELTCNSNLNIVIKRKKFSTYQTLIPINKKIKVFEGGTAEKFINKADIIIGHNSGSTLESLINGKYVMIPFFEKSLKLKKYLFKFNKNIIYTSEHKMKKDILNLINKKAVFPLINNKNKKTAEYYFGSSKNIVNNYVNFLTQ